MQKIDNIIEQVKQGIQRQEMFIARENPETEDGRKNIEFYRCKIAELEYRIKELEEKKKETSSILVPKWDMMFYDPTLWMPVNTYLVKGKVPFQLMLSANYPNYKSNNTKSISIELPFDILLKEENEEYLRYMLELIKIYSGDNVNLVLGNGVSTRGMLSFIADKELSVYSAKELGYYDFFDRLCDNNVRNIIYVGDSMKKGIKSETVDKVQSEIIDFHKKLTANEVMSEEELEKSNEKIKQRILSISKHL
ncbi:MAG: hypothetical protein HFH86_01325 [Bacilli bacterium]|jgi:hypothetical protein|nr:hypothetical protein [Bacilli bacterium]